MTTAIYLHKEKQDPIKRGHPWVFPKAIMKQKGNLRDGMLVEVLSCDGEKIGTGIYNSHSLYRVRMLAYAFEQFDTSSVATIVRSRLIQAKQLRCTLGLPNATTNAYRLLNSEGDGLSGLTLDCFHDVVVVSSSAYWVEAHKEDIIQSIDELIKPQQVVWQAQSKALAQDGWEQSTHEVEVGSIDVLEAGIIYRVQLGQSQKTGLFLDQRDNHQRLASLTTGKRVLDLYCYTGGFALHAAKAKAALVTAVDSSQQAIALAKRNAQLNGLESIEFIEADARDYLTKAGDYDVIILDPPKLIPSKRHLTQAKNYYRFLHRELFKVMNSGTLLLTCNCSSAITAQEFNALVANQAMAVNKLTRNLGIFGPALCHPTLAAFPEGQYLTAILMGVV